jgi:hypothetical protein
MEMLYTIQIFMFGTKTELVYKTQREPFSAWYCLQQGIQNVKSFVSQDNTWSVVDLWKRPLQSKQMEIILNIDSDNKHYNDQLK